MKTQEFSHHTTTKLELRLPTLQHRIRGISSVSFGQSVFVQEQAPACWLSLVIPEADAYIFSYPLTLDQTEYIGSDL